MRYSTLPLRLALLTGAALCAVPTFAQQTMLPVPAAPATLAPAPAFAPLPDATLSVPLTIPVPPGAKLRAEMDARSEDILGVMKSFLKGIGETGERTVPPAPGQPMPSPNPVADMLANGNLADMLKDVNHVHFVVYELAAPPAPPMIITPVPRKGLKVMPLVTMPPVIVTPTPAFDSNAFYEGAFDAEGAHRIMFADADEYKLVMVGFPDRKGYAFAVSGGGYVAVSRTDGYPNLEVLSAFISRATAEVMKSKLVKDAVTKTMNGDKLIGPTSVDKIAGDDNLKVTH